LNNIRDEFKNLSLTSVISAYSLSLPVYLRGQALIEARIAKIKDLLDTELYIHGQMEVSSSVNTQAVAFTYSYIAVDRAGWAP
jgi:hypothetical protein